MFLRQFTKAESTDKQICNSHKQAKNLKEWLVLTYMKENNTTTHPLF
jgi:hypothetical protein